jgi:phage head maturation protease
MVTELPAMVETKQKIAPQQLRALIDPKTINKEERTVEVVAATEAAIRMWGWDQGYFDETLSMKDGEVRLERLNANGPLLDNHDRYSGIKGQYGTVVRAWLDGKKLRCVIKFSKRADVEPFWQDIQDGILKGISIGYRVYTYEIVEKEGEIPQYRAIDWEPYEVSLAPVPADYRASVRSADENKYSPNEVIIRSQNTPTKMEKTEEQLRKEGEAAERKRQSEIRTAIRAAKLDDSFGQTLIDAGHTIERSRELISAEVTRVSTPAPDAEKARGEGATAERTRAKEIRTAVRKAGLEDSYAETLIDAGHTIEKSREMILDKWAETDPNAGARGQNTAPTVNKDEADKRRSGMAEAIAFRANPDSFSGKRLEEMDKNEYRGMSLLRMAEMSLTAQGAKVRGLSDTQLAQLAMNGGSERSGMHTSSDFPIILGNTVNRTLRAEYELAERTFPQWARRASAKDFRTITRAQLGDFSNLSQVNEGGEYEYGTLGEGSEAYRVFKYGKIIAISWEMIINDDLDAFGRIPQKIANSVARKQSDLVYGILSTNAAMSDTVALFHATHGNLGTAGAITIDSLGEARKLLRKQKGLGALDYLNLTPKTLLVGPNYEQIALQYLSSAYNPNDPTKINPWKGLLTPVVEPRLTGNEWYVMATPGQIDTVEYAFLEGQPEIFTETKQGFDVDGLQMKVRMVFGTKAIDWRGMVKNAGA